jgi:hypothetical protein
VAGAIERTDGVVTLVYANYEKNGFYKSFQRSVFEKICSKNHFQKRINHPSGIPLKRNRHPLQTMVWRGNYYIQNIFFILKRLLLV